SAGSATLTTKQSSAASSSASMIFRPPSLLSSTPGMRAPNPSSGLQPCSPSRKNSPGVAERSSRSSPAAPARNPENGGKRLYSYFADTTLASRRLLLSISYPGSDFFSILLELCRHVWPEDTDDNMYAYLGRSNTFWMSVRAGKQTHAVPPAPLQYFLNTHLTRFLALFPNAVILAAGRKAQLRLRSVHVEFESCSAFTRP